MTQACIVPWPKEALQTLEETRLLGNNFYKCKQYRAAAMIYRSGLGLVGLIAPGVAPNFFGDTIPERLPEEVDKQYLALLINTAQALLNIPPKDMHGEVAAMDASVVCEAASSHLQWILLKWHNLTFADFVRQLQHSTCPSKVANLGDRLAKMRSRRSLAMERCGNISGALNDHFNAFCKLPAGVTEQDRLERAVLGFGSPDSGLKLPKEAIRIYSRPLECCHRAAVTFRELPDVKKGGTSMGTIAGAFSCGKYREAAMVVMSYARADNTAGQRYIIGHWRGTGEQTMFHTCYMFTPPAQMVFQSGAVLGGVLYCVSMSLNCCELRGFHMLESYKISHPFQVPLRLAPTSDVTLARQDAAMVACSGALYVFGGCIQEAREGSDRVASNDLIVFEPNLSIFSVQCAVIQTGHERPAARWGHATFVQGKYIYIFGGMSDHHAVSSWGMYANDIWQFDVMSRTWTRVEIFSCIPCPRAHMGVAFDERRAVIVGGVTAMPDGRKVHLADVWEFDYKSCCWVQVVPEKPSEEPWISARSGAACSLMDGNTLVTHGGVGRYGPVGRDEMTAFTIKRGIGARIAAKAGNSGPQRDGAVMKACGDMTRMKMKLAALPAWARELFTAPAGSVQWLAMCSTDLVEATFNPAMKSDARYKPFLPSDCIFSPDSIQPIRPLGGSPENVWGSSECPFDLAPRWLTAPLEVSVNLASASSANQRLKGPVNLRQTVKRFGTVKAAVEYFKLCKPCVHLSGWQHIEVLDTPALTAAGIRWEVQECAGIVIEDAPGGRQQIYMMGVVGPVFFCFLVTRCPQQKSLSATKLCTLMLRTQMHMLNSPIPMVATYCHHCGKRDPDLSQLNPDLRPKKTIKVCRGCHLVRYCGTDCQRVDWEAPYGHKEVCKKYASQLPQRRR
ncbi:probable leucine-zipper-like transcriptional regulator 1 at N-terminal half [Coccomyxa sp. Obi]|nr:probable leucine-zipper-like transcriptional regulator 1 at N-terminal half [Coccomyxa sp. Obi]